MAQPLERTQRLDILNLVLAIVGVLLGLFAIPASLREWRKRRWHVLDVWRDWSGTGSR